MIDRYTSKEMKQWWSDTYKFQQYLNVELASLSALKDRKIIDAKTFEKLAKATFTLTGIEKHEAILNHDVLAFVESCRDSLGEEKRWFHFGLTSSDVIDSAHSLIFKTINDHLNLKIETLAKLLKAKAYQYQHTPIMARTHGMYAEPTVYGLRYVLWFDDLQRLKKPFLLASEAVEVLKLSGSIGTYPILPPDHEQTVAKLLGLKTSGIHTQIMQRDRHASYLFSLVNLAGLIEKIALDIRLLSRSEVMEVAEAFGAKQKGSSAMPHKRNPIQSENLMGLARLMRGYLTAMNENQALWHERDISHSSVERVVFMDATTVMDHMLSKVTKLIDQLEVHPEHMQKHIDESYDTHWTQVILHQAILQGMDREDVYRVLQATAFDAMQQKTSMLVLLKTHPMFQKVALSNWIKVGSSIDELYQKVLK
ncbi:MAG: adenylosuccinate lyase [Firmicutes bacterium]|nr:adenylosuccinate lyase [Bacillota bacterium]